MRVYPAIGYVIVLAAMMIIGAKNISFADIAAQTKSGILFTLIIIYFGNLVLISALGQITMYEKYPAAWIFFTTPVEKPGSLISGSIKAAIAQFFFPLATLIFILLTVVAGPAVIPNVLLGISNELLITAVLAYISVNKLPFSAPLKNNAGSMLRVFAVMILGVTLAIAHYFLYPITIAVSILAVLSLTAAWYVLNSINNLTWKKVGSRYSDSE